MTANTFVVNRNNVLVTKKIIINNFDAKAKFNKINQKTYLGPALSSTFGIVCRKIVNMAAQKQAKSE